VWLLVPITQDAVKVGSFQVADGTPGMIRMSAFEFYTRGRRLADVLEFLQVHVLLAHRTIGHLSGFDE
jgi:MarR-like DNA-binding transcriptional regulator SgrR of sgrS sRNA